MSAKPISETLGAVLSKARNLKNLTLREAEELTGISNAYISQLENDKVKKPAADILYKLASFYKMDFSYVLQLAGLVQKSSAENMSFGNFVFSKENLTPEEEAELINYLKFIRERHKK